MKKHILCSVTFFTPYNHDVYEVMRENMLQPDRPQMAT